VDAGVTDKSNQPKSIGEIQVVPVDWAYSGFGDIDFTRLMPSALPD